jgi:hypothetical protein
VNESTQWQQQGLVMVVYLQALKGSSQCVRERGERF